jgi:hypothetical protein
MMAWIVKWLGVEEGEREEGEEEEEEMTAESVVCERRQGDLSHPTRLLMLWRDPPSVVSQQRNKEPRPDLLWDERPVSSTHW